MKLKITAKLLEDMNACERARKLVAPLLPVTIYTDPEKNIDIAAKLISLYDNTSMCNLKSCFRCRRWLPGDLRWMVGQRAVRRLTDADYINDHVTLTDFDYTTTTFRPLQILEITQMLSMIAESKIG